MNLKRKGIVSKDKKALIVVPNISLVGQTAEKFDGDYQTGLLTYNVMQIGGSNKYSDKKFDEAFRSGYASATASNPRRA
jgi:hypothetical protein